MSDLEDAAQEAVERVEELQERVEKANAAFDAADAQLRQTASEVQEAWADLIERLESFRDAVHGEKERLDAEAAEADKALSDLQDAIASAEGEVEGELGDTREQIEALGEAMTATEPQVDALVQRLGGDFDTLVSHAETLQTSIQDAATPHREALAEETVQDLKDDAEQAEERADAVKLVMAEDCTQALEAAFDDCSGKLAQVVEVVEGAFSDARDHVQEVVEYSLEECANEHHRVLDELKELASVVAEAMEKLKSAVALEQDKHEQGREGLADACQETAAQAQKMTEALKGVKQLMASFSFVGM